MKRILTATFAALALMAAPAMAMEIDLTDDTTFVLGDTGDPGMPDMTTDTTLIDADMLDASRSIDTIVMFSPIDTATMPAVMPPTDMGDSHAATWASTAAKTTTTAPMTPPEVGGTQSLPWPSAVM